MPGGSPDCELPYHISLNSKRGWLPCLITSAGDEDGDRNEDDLVEPFSNGRAISKPLPCLGQTRVRLSFSYA
jgi:hypothetical protein